MVAMSRSARPGDSWQSNTYAVGALGPSAFPSLSSLATRYSNERPDKWAPVPEGLDRTIARDHELAAVARRARDGLAYHVERRFGPFDSRYLDAILYVPRERFVLPEDIALSADDMPTPLDAEGHATVSAPHAYLLTFRLLGLEEGDHLLELGTGSGYGSALARYIVGPEGHVTSIEIAPTLHARAARLLGADHHGEADGVTLLLGDGRALAAEVLSGAMMQRAPTKVAVTYALSEPPSAIEDLLPNWGAVVAPIEASPDVQELVRTERRGGRLVRTSCGSVLYVRERKSIDA